MPKQIEDFTDFRLHQWCIHCGRKKSEVTLNRDHVPSKSLVDKEFHHELQVTQICKSCNDSFSLDEEYLLCFLSATLSGCTNPEKQIIKKAAVKFQENEGLRARIDKQEIRYETQSGENRSVWKPELDRIETVVVKNARGHFYHELSEPLLKAPDKVFIAPMATMKASDLSAIAFGQQFAPWGEVGSRWNRRVLSEDIFDELGFAIVQPSVYKYRVFTDEVRVDSIIRDYLYTSVIWVD